MFHKSEEKTITNELSFLAHVQLLLLHLCSTTLQYLGKQNNVN